MLPIGDIVIQKRHDDGTDEILLMIERKTVRDLVQSLKDGRHHDQRKRWLEFRGQSPNSFVSLWIEGDLLMAPMDDTVRSSLVNSLFRLQSKHNILVHHARSREAFLTSLRIVIGKLEKDAYHLVPDDTRASSSSVAVDMNRFRKSAHSQEQYWQDCLTLIPGVSPQTAHKIQTLFPTMMSMMKALEDDPRHTWAQISEIRASEKRKLGGKLAQKIVQHIDPTISFLDQPT
jgi:ERCC4-type nuclease